MKSAMLKTVATGMAVSIEAKGARMTAPMRAALETEASVPGVFQKRFTPPLNQKIARAICPSTNTATSKAPSQWSDIA